MENTTFNVLCTYRPLIDIGRTYSIVYNGRDITAQVKDSSGSKILPVTGYPKEIVDSPRYLKFFLSHSYFTLEGSSDGSYQYVRAIQRLVGGVFGGQYRLPTHPGYDLGGIIRKEQLEIPLLEEKRADLNDLLQVATQHYQDSFKDAEHQPTSEKDAIVSAHQAEVNKFKHELERNAQELNRHRESEAKVSLPPVEEMLPIDPACDKVRYVRKSHASETMRHLLIRGSTNTPPLILLDQIRKFASQLLYKDAPLLITRESLQAVVSGIKSLLSDQDREISLVGSIITLPYVQVLDPIVIRETSTVSRTLIENAKHYYVLSQAVMGGAFFGYGYSLTSSEYDTKTPEGIKKLMSKISISSYTCRGALPRLQPDLENQNLLRIYASWHEELLSDKENGYPIAFKPRELEEVLRENKKIIP